MWMKYEFLHYPDIKEATVTVEAVEGNNVTLKTVSTYYDGSTLEETVTVNVGQGEKKTVVPLDSAEGWNSTHGNNVMKVADNYLEIIMTPKGGYAEVIYTFKEDLDLSEVSYFYYYVSVTDVAEGERYTIWLTDADGKSRYLPVQFNVNDPRKPQYLVWDKKEWFNFNTVSKEELDRARIKSVSLVYDGNFTRIVKLKNFETDQPLTHGFGSFKFFVVSTGLVKGDPTYPDVPYVVNEELPSKDNPEPVILQHSYRDLLVSYTDCEGGSCSSAYTYDRETGILVKYWTAKSGVQIQLVDQRNGWSPPNLAVFAVALMHEFQINYLQPYFWYIVGAVSIYVVGFTGATVYDRWRRGVLTWGVMKQWWPFLVILLILFVLGEAIRRLGM